jgi:hypothetical protein
LSASINRVDPTVNSNASFTATHIVELKVIAGFRIGLLFDTVSVAD